MTLIDDWGFKVDCTGLWVSGRCNRQSQTVAVLDKVVDSMELIDFLGWKNTPEAFGDEKWV